MKKRLQQATNELKDVKRKIAALESKEGGDARNESEDPRESHDGDKSRVRFNQRS